jgi:hypothetical protein
MYEGTKHAFASDAVARGVDLYRLRDFLGHTDARSTEKYAKLAPKQAKNALFDGNEKIAKVSLSQRAPLPFAPGAWIRPSCHC